MPKAKKINKGLIKLIARTRMLYLYELAHEIFPSDKKLANRYAYLARKYSQRAKIKIPHAWKKRTCHHCKKFLYPGINCRTRLHSQGKGSHVSMTCLECNQVTRYYIKSSK
ncbi:MAG: ribonuclease P [Candidatus Lokiarchaeota archaeon]|nr:ribonuclease P [Candidatus Lokiarchaeota archaeon]